MNFESDQNAENINPEIVISDSSFKFNLRNILLILAILIILIEAGWLLFQYLGRQEEVSEQLVQIKKEPINLTLSSTKNEYNLGENIEVLINLSSGTTEVEGVDVELSYDANILEASSSSILKGEIFSEYPQMEVLTNEGKIRISAISAVGESFTGSGTIGKVQFRAKKVGETQINFAFTPGLTTDSNIVNTKSNKDLLEKVQNISIMIR